MKKGPSRSAEALQPAWCEEWVPLAEICRIDKLQVRHKLNQGAVTRYRDMTDAGKVAPPIKLGRVKSGALYLVDGWHRMEAGALDTQEDFNGTGGTLVRALVADLTDAEVRWESAIANEGHGVQLKPSEYRNVFRAFILAKKHRKARGELMTYREIGEAIGKGHRTIHEWMRKDFPRMAARMGRDPHGNPGAGPPVGRVPSLADEQCEQTLRAVRDARAGLATMTPEHRHRVAEELRSLLAEVTQLGATAPADDGEF
ncbi:MAG: hypothetical protein KGM91_04505 [Burkholderiales bacterium]|nr:hypothetical protein [Burkholderiales bacterium]